MHDSPIPIRGEAMGYAEVDVEEARWRLERSDARRARVHARPDELQKAESHIPDGPSAFVYEAGLLPWVMGAWAVVGILVVAGLMISNGWRAVLLGEALLLMGYSVSWIVVWGAGMMRAHDEHQIEAHIIDEHRVHGTH